MKKILAFTLAIIMVVLLIACSNDGPKIDIITSSGRKPSFFAVGKPTIPMVLRVFSEKSVFKIDEEITLYCGVGDTTKYRDYDVSLYIEGVGFTINESKDEYEKEYTDFADSKYNCVKKWRSYIPKYNEEIKIKIKEANNGEICFQLINSAEDGTSVRLTLYYASNNEYIVLSVKSYADARKRLDNL